MWNIFKKSKLKHLEEIASKQIVNYILASHEADIKKRLLNKDVDITKLNKFLASQSRICITNIYDAYNVIGFINNYTYDIKKTDNEKYEVIIDGKLIITIDPQYENDIYVTICIGEKHNNILCNGTIGSILANNVQGGIDISLCINVPIKEDIEIDKLI